MLRSCSGPPTVSLVTGLSWGRTAVRGCLMATIAAIVSACSGPKATVDDFPALSQKPLPPLARQTDPAQRNGLGRPADPSGTDYKWNGSPDRTTEGAAPPAPAVPRAPLPGALAPRPAASPGTTKPDGQTIVVQPGDTLYGLSRHHGVSISALMDANKLKSLTLQPGQTLRLPTAHRGRG